MVLLLNPSGLSLSKRILEALSEIEIISFFRGSAEEVNTVGFISNNLLEAYPGDFAFDINGIEKSSSSPIGYVFFHAFPHNSISASNFIGFVHKPGVHCITSALRDVFEFHGFNLSEEMLFGLGSGLSLGYISIRGSPDPILGGRSRNPEDIACKRLGVGIKKFTTNDPEKGWLRLKERLDKGIPSMILIDMAYLPYQDLPEDYHFGQHGIAICG